MSIVLYSLFFLLIPEGGQAACAEIHSARQLLQCAETEAPEVKKLRNEHGSALAKVGAASAWPNPALEWKSVSGKAESQSETEISLSIPIEVGVRSAKKEIAESRLSQAEMEMRSAGLEARGQAWLKLHRLRQLLHEIEVLEESIATFGKLLSQFSGRKGLSPEQEISISVFRMAKSEADLKKAEGMDELAALETYFGLNTGKSLAEVKLHLPPSPKIWPDIKIASAEKSPRYQASLAELKAAEGELRLAQRESWPALTIGPAMKIVKESGRSDHLYGFSVGLPLPLFSLNGGNRAVASAGVQAAETGRASALVSEDLKRRELSRQYESSVTVLKETLSHQEIEKKHADVERLFLRGIVPSSLVIEAHRSFVDLEKARNERELKALAALTEIYALDGKKVDE